VLEIGIAIDFGGRVEMNIAEALNTKWERKE
jgi:hypothetical protein